MCAVYSVPARGNETYLSLVLRFHDGGYLCLTSIIGTDSSFALFLKNSFIKKQRNTNYSVKNIAVERVSIDSSMLTIVLSAAASSPMLLQGKFLIRFCYL